MAFDLRRIAVFEPHQDLETNPTLVSLLRALSSNGAQVDVFMPDTGVFPPIKSHVTRYRFPEQWSLWRGGIRSTLRGWWRYIHQVTVDQLFAKRGYDLILGIDSAGIIMAYKYAKKFNIPLVYLSFEIFFNDELSSKSEVREKERECIASHFAQLIIVQDEIRGRLLASENNLYLERFEYLPVSPNGFPKINNSRYLRDRFNISEDQTIVLHPGSFSEWTYANELIENVWSWPDGFVLVVHTRYRPGLMDEHVRKIEKDLSGKIVLSREPLSASEYEELVASADIGLILYKPMPTNRYVQKNIENIGFASGKFSFCMKYGIPAISINQRFYAKLLEDYDFGENITSLEELPAALDRVRSRRAHHQAEAQRLFSEKLDFNIHWPRIKARMADIMK